MKVGVPTVIKELDGKINILVGLSEPSNVLWWQRAKLNSANSIALLVGGT